MDMLQILDNICISTFLLGYENLQLGTFVKYILSHFYSHFTLECIFKNIIMGIQFV